jgi:hypothetical protein
MQLQYGSGEGGKISRKSITTSDLFVLPHLVSSFYRQQVQKQTYFVLGNTLSGVSGPIFEWSPPLNEEWTALLGFWSLPVAICSSQAAEVGLILAELAKDTPMPGRMTLVKEGTES